MRKLLFLLSITAFTNINISNANAASCNTPIDSNIKNSCMVVPSVLWRGAKPDAAAATSLVQHGVKTIVNLELLHDDLSAFKNASVKLLAPLSIQYYRIRDWEPLVAFSNKSVDKHVIDFIAITRGAPTPIYVHCRSGRNRTGVMVAAYKVFNGTPIEDAVTDMQRYKGEWFKQDANYIRTLTPAKISQLEGEIVLAQNKLKNEAVIVCANSGCKISKN